jgi:hypothetical protein
MWRLLYTGAPRGLKSLSVWIRILLGLIGVFSTLVEADCQCGYSFAIHSTSYVFTDILESDFLHLADISLDTDWSQQGYNVSATTARGSFGESFQTVNVLSNPLIDNFSYTGSSQRGGDAGLQLYVQGGNPYDGLVSVAQINSVRDDMLWGSYRASIKLTNVPGTCGAFFWVSTNASAYLQKSFASLVQLR